MNSHIYINQMDLDGSWSIWEEFLIGGLTDAAPAAVAFNGGCYVFHKGMNSHIYFSAPVDWQEVPGGGVTDSALAAATFGPYLYVFHKGLNGHIYQTLLYPGGSWRGSWQEVPGGFVADAAPAAMSFNNCLYAFAAGKNDHHLYYTKLVGSMENPLPKKGGQGVIRSGAFSVTTDPSGAEVLVDGMSRGTYGGTEPITVSNLAAGTHTIKCRCSGYNDVSMIEDVQPGTTKNVRCILHQIKGTLVIDSTPAGAGVSVDGVIEGPAPQTVPNVAPGPHTIKCVHQGCIDDERSVTVEAGRTTEVHCVLQKVTAGTLAIVTRPSGAEVLVDGVSRGTFTGPEDEPLIIPNLGLGPHKVICRLAGYQDDETTITIEPGNNPLFCQLLHEGTLNIETNPGAEVLVDGVYRGTMPENYCLAVRNLAPGPHVVRCKLAGYQDCETTATVEAGDNHVICNLLLAEGVVPAGPPISGSITVNANSYPGTVSPGGSSQISVLAMVNGQPLPEAEVDIGAGGGYFEGGYDELGAHIKGKTDSGGVFKAIWHPFKMVYKTGENYRLSIEVEKPGCETGRGDVLIRVPPGWTP